MPRSHTTISGHRIEYPDPDPKLAKFLARVQALAKDKKSTENDLIVLVYGSDNPILDHTIFPGRGAVTRDVLPNPVYRVLMDVLARKRFEETGTSIERVARRYTLSVPEAAKRLGIAQNSVRVAIHSQRVSSWVRDGEFFLDPDNLEGLEGPRRGPKARAAPAPIEYRAGYDPKSNAIVRIKHVRGEVSGNKPIEGTIDRWRRVGVLEGAGGKMRFLELEPSDQDGVVELRGLFVRGKFRIASKVNSAAKAQAAWDAFEAA